jgi:hypothetical protein
MNDDVNQALESAGRDVRAMVTEAIDVDADLSAALQRSPQPADESHGPARSRVGLIVVGVAAAMVLLLVGVLAVVSGGSADDVPTGTIEAPPDRTIAPATIEGSTPTTEQASEISAPPPSVERSTPTTEQASEISAPPPSAPLSRPLLVSLPPQPVVVPVSYVDPPELYEPEPFASIAVSATTDEYGGFAVGDGIVVITERGPVITVVDVNTGSATSQALAVEVTSPVLGPGNVLYGLSIPTITDPQQQVPQFSLIAQSLDTDPSIILDAVSVGTVSYMEIPAGTFVAGPDGIYDVERARGKVMDFVGTTDTTTSSTVIALENEPDPIVRTINGAAEWAIPVEADPNAASLYSGPTPPAPGPNGTTRVVRHIGPRLETEPVDYGTPTKQVIADLTPGAGRWWSLPDDWRAVASSSYGTLLVRGSGGNIDLAWFQPTPSPPLPFWPTTVLASDDNNILELERDDTGARTQRWPGDRVGWANGCTPDEIDALFAEAPEGSVLEQLACDRTSPSIAEADFSTGSVRSTISLIDDPTSASRTSRPPPSSARQSFRLATQSRSAHRSETGPFPTRQRSTRSSRTPPHQQSSATKSHDSCRKPRPASTQPPPSTSCPPAPSSLSPNW